ncbi:MULTISPECIES: hypothetical protein [Pseudoalteromonas]|uniref:hypothetical protein n=1 Tax=Pseudoalteromonas TaxID=53246 RepID=UPI0002C991A7|nr:MULTISPECIES: hypothetical protein [Pseudoalteromonas]ENN99775.1 hypothetical protein J139_04200 [Pseudoalteromonas agarivorans S816]TMS64760.1 hypothetical protein CWB83_15835 [Pseudoalteromonas sp. S1691]TMS72430.1 hypothetical protein CWB86_01970 [Pseudoalteromonas sp. S1731]TMS73487.1 hypothetical protein CWB88_11935 [Pseudoalteromonas sp. S1941]TMS76396.1 hypothetical protein CWB82_17255 [Pseudoalteromonas sp. S1690]
MAISKEQWAEIEKQLAGLFGSVIFKYGEFEITVIRGRVSESKTSLVVYVDDVIKGGWYSKDIERPSCIPDVWRKRTRARYTTKSIKDAEKVWGKRRAKKEMPELYEKTEYHTCDFTTAKSLVCQYKKLEGLELIKIGDKTYDDYIKV